MGSDIASQDGIDFYDTTWGEIVELKYGKSLKNYKDSLSKFPVYGTNGPVGYTGAPLCNYPSVIVGRKGAYRGIHFSSMPFYVIDTAFYIEPKYDLNMKWVYYNLLTQDINGLDSGSAIPSTRREDFYALTVRVPPRKVQDQIVKKLDSINEKINLNRQINQTLEQMAQALFKSWLVDFDPVIDNALDAGNTIPDALTQRTELRKTARASDDFQPLSDDVRQLFPSEFEESELGWIPKGWEVKTLSDITVELRRGISPKYTETDGIQVLNQKCIRNHEVNFSLSRRNNTELRKVEGRELQIGDVLVNSTGVGTLGRMAQVTYINEATVVDSHVTVVRANQDIFPIYSFGQLMLSNEAKVEALGEGSTGQTELSRKILSEQKVIIPPMKILNISENVFLSNAKKQVILSKEIISLAKIRDTLLPKLISGELRLDSTEVEQAKSLLDGE